MLFKLSNLNSNFVLTLGYLNPALNNSALESNRGIGVRFTANGKNVNLYHVTKLTIYLPFTVPYNYTESSFIHKNCFELF